jgi:S1 RNA binding domain
MAELTMVRELEIKGNNLCVETVDGDVNLESLYSGKPYTSAENELLLALKKVSKDKGIPVAQAARAISDILGRNWEPVYKRMNSLKDDKVEDTWSDNMNMQEEKPRDNDEVKLFTMEDIGMTVAVKVTKILPYGAFCYDLGGRSGLLPKRSISSEFVKNPADYLRVGDVIKVKVVEDRMNPGRTELSAKAFGDIVAIKNRK